MSREQWEIVEVGKHYMVDDETGTFTTKEPTPKKLLRRKVQ